MATPQTSAGIMVFRRGEASVEVLLAHPGGPFWARKDDGAWSIPKGLHDADSDVDLRAAAAREFAEEVGQAAPDGAYLDLGTVKLSSGKLVTAWAVEGNLDPAGATSNTFDLEWPRGSGRIVAFPEVDRVEWFAIEAARSKLTKSQLPLLDRLVELLGAG